MLGEVVYPTLNAVGRTNLNKALHHTINPTSGRIGLPPLHLHYSAFCLIFATSGKCQKMTFHQMILCAQCLVINSNSNYSDHNLDAIIDCNENLSFQVEEGISTIKVEQI